MLGDPVFALRDKQRSEVFPERLPCLHGQPQEDHFAAGSAGVGCEAFHVYTENGREVR